MDYGGLGGSGFCIYSDLKSFCVTRMCHYGAGAFVSWAGTPKVSYYFIDVGFAFPSALWIVTRRSCLPLLMRKAVHGSLTHTAEGRILHGSK